jgi:hypothetical protein
MSPRFLTYVRGSSRNCDLGTRKPYRDSCRRKPAFPASAIFTPLKQRRNKIIAECQAGKRGRSGAAPAIFRPPSRAAEKSRFALRSYRADGLPCAQNPQDRACSRPLKTKTENSCE